MANGPHKPFLFLSYASADQERALTIASALERSGILVWIDRTGISAGLGWAEEIVSAVRNCAALVVLCSPASIASRNVRQELQLAWDNDRPILPVVLEQVEFPDAMSYFLQGRQWVDAASRSDAEWMGELIAGLERLGILAAEQTSPIPKEERIDLPVPPGPLIGRDREVDDILVRFHGGSRLLTLTGPGGVGKTRLALEAARRVVGSMAGDAAFIDLAPITNAELVPSTIAQALDIRESGDRTIRESLRTALRNRRLLLVLDNFEQVIDAAPVVSELLAAAPDLRVLVTSREALRVRGEEEVVIDPLDLPTEQDAADPVRLAKSPSVALFVATAQASKSGFALTADNARAVLEICRRLDGLPLAIELAATRVKHLPPITLLDQLKRRLSVLTGGPRDLPARQQTLRDTIAWSYDQLTADEQALFRRLGVFAGSAGFGAIAAVVPAAGLLEIDLLSGLASLVDKSLLRERMDRDGSPRFTMLELIREYALEQLDQAGESEVASRTLAEWIVRYVEFWSGAEYVAFLKLIDLQSIDEEVENIRTAIHHFSTQGDAESCARLFIGLFTYFYLRGRFREAASLGHGALELAREHALSDRLRAITMSSLAVLETILGDAPRGESLGRKGLSILQRSPDTVELIPGAMIQLAIAVREQGRYAEAMEYSEQAYLGASKSGNQDFASFAQYHIGKLAYLQNDLDRALVCLTDALHRSNSANSNETNLWSALYLTAVHTRRRESVAAAAALRKADRWWRETGSEFAGLSLDFSGALAASFRPVDAVRIFGAEVTHTAAIGVNVEDEPWIAEVKRELQEELGEEAYEAAFAEGQSLTLNEALALMRDVLEEIDGGSASEERSLSQGHVAN